MTAQTLDVATPADLVEAAARRLVEGFQCRCRADEWNRLVAATPPAPSSAVGMSKGCSNRAHHDIWRAHDVLIGYADRLRAGEPAPTHPDDSDRAAAVATRAHAWRALHPGWSRTDQLVKTIVSDFETAAGVGPQTPSRHGTRIAARPTPGQAEQAADITALPALIAEIAWLVEHGDRCAASLKTDPTRQCPRRGTWRPYHARPLCWQHTAHPQLHPDPATHTTTALADHPTLHAVRV